ncbi:N-acetylmuramoyl-L-alanine amidase [Rhodalgimonas zhirmunskyi]|uniref:N-acetylmuramoyl-L-alanine amidase n=1 Tax=Rhodalgimonas zhirmunskyi TaxID=2964767 RepID=A0AAJ1UBV0_9RHOB|nr:N-acetylmuramoyl-L-alanine amidase [Rhodoalgimonas zhirmunskyi]MDQ2094993.1 N-acetylmuramoyl-L-alanine amidase [Rhodoalgimonas zhirmunskyi]
MSDGTTEGTVISHPSPNHGARRGATRPCLIVLHYTAMESAEAALQRLCDPQAEVSAHYLICEQGRIWQMVDEAERAWHAGAGRWGACCDVNSASIGIELANRGDHPFAEAQMRALEGLLPAIMRRWHIPPEGVIGHSDMAPGRKGDPGRRFDWARLERQGLARRRGENTGLEASAGRDDPDPACFRGLARELGYSAEVDDATLLEAVRLRYRPWGTGPLAREDCTALGTASHWT